MTKSKADTIRKLLGKAANNGMSSAEIATIVGCNPSYVRTVNRRMKNGYAADVARIAALCLTGDREAANEAGRAAYRAARNDGADVVTATRVRISARRRVLFKTGDRKLGSSAWKAAHRAT